MTQPNIFKYDNYRLFLKDWFCWQKAERPTYSYRFFSKMAGFKSPNQLLLVIQGKRNIALKSLDRFFTALKLKKSEKRYFEILVKFNQTKDMAQKKEYLNQMSAHWLKKRSFLEDKQYRFMTNWYFSAIRELTALKNFQENHSWIAKQLGSLITPTQARQSIALLLDLKILTRDNTGRLKPTNEYITTGNEVSSVAAYLYHMQMIKLAMQSLSDVPASKRNITALTFTMRKKDYEMVVDEIIEFRKRLVSILQNRDSTGDDEMLYQLNLHLFPLNKGGE